MESQEKRKQFFEATVKNTRFEQLSASSDIGQGVIMGYEQALKDSKQWNEYFKANQSREEGSGKLEEVFRNFIRTEQLTAKWEEFLSNNNH